MQNKTQISNFIIKSGELNTFFFRFFLDDNLKLETSFSR